LTLLVNDLLALKNLGFDVINYEAEAVRIDHVEAKEEKNPQNNDYFERTEGGGEEAYQRGYSWI
jgi:hypothetical protein